MEFGKQHDTTDFFPCYRLVMDLLQGSYVETGVMDFGLYQLHAIQTSAAYLQMSTKVCVYQTLVLPILTYACETWTLLAADIKRLEGFHLKCQRQIAKIRRQDHVRNTDVSSLTGLGPCAGFSHPSSQLTVWTCSQTSRGHICPPTFAMPHRSVSRLPSRP